MAATVSELLGQHTTLSIECVDRLYLNGWVPFLTQDWHVPNFLRNHLGNPVPSPAILHRRQERFRAEVEAYAKRLNVPLVRFEKGKRKDDIATRIRAERPRSSGLDFVGVAQERCRAFRGTKRVEPSGRIDFTYKRQWVFVNHYYFYVRDEQWGPAFVKVGSYLPYPVKLCLNGHEWAKRQLDHESIGYKALDNGFLTCQQPQRLQQLCSALGAQDIDAFFRRWVEQLPWPLDAQARKAGYVHELSFWQFELSLTHVFQRPVQGRHFFEQLIRDNIDLGRPDRVSLCFPHRLNKRTPPPARGYQTRVITRGVNPRLLVDYKTSNVKQYFKQERALRTETTINNPWDFRINKSLPNFEPLRNAARQVNGKLLEMERVSQHCTLEAEQLDRLQRPTKEHGQRASALRFGDRRVMALFNALCLFLCFPVGFRNRDLRKHIADLLGLSMSQYRPGCMTYDLRRLRRKGLIERQPGTYRYHLTPYGRRVVYFNTRIYLRVLRPAAPCLSGKPDKVHRPLRHAFEQLDATIEQLCKHAEIKAAASFLT